MRATLRNRWEDSKITLITLSAPTLKPEVFIPVRPPLATATIREMLAAKAVAA